jgi:hypothetical protein
MRTCATIGKRTFHSEGLICMSIRTRSPIFYLETAIAGCAFNIAPERASKLAVLRDARNITLEVTDDTDFRIRVNPQRGNITVPVAAAEYPAHCFFQPRIRSIRGLSAKVSGDWTSEVRFDFAKRRPFADGPLTT